MSNSPASQPAASLLLFTLVIGAVMAMLDVTAVNVALPDIALNLAVPLTGLVWVVDAYTLSFAALLLAGGALADRFGTKKVYQGGLALFVLASVLCGLASSGAALVAARLLQGAGAALFMPSSLSLLSHAFEDERRRASMLGRWSAFIGAAGALGPLAGGLLVHQFGWRGVFWINVPLGLLGIALAQALLPAAPPHPRPLSLFSHGLGVVALSALSFVLIEGQGYGWTSAPVLAATALAALSGAVLLRRERRGAHPLLPRALFERPTFAAANGIGFLVNFAAYGQLFLVSLYLQRAAGTDALEAGLKLLPMMGSFTIGNLLSGRITARLGVRGPMLAGLAGAAAIAALLMNLTPATPYLWLALSVTVMNALVGVAVPAMTSTVMQVAGRRHASSAAAALNANRQIGALVGVALMGTILHALPDWHLRLPLAFGAIALAYLLAAGLVWRHVAPPGSALPA
ncbi:DHA2 family methylenomycin A resistance protein-like MFS transporter [Oxalobacteraceae bacterium GrIS 1.11]